MQADKIGELGPYFTVFIPTFNRAHLLPRALESITKQSFRDFEVVIVDDGSTDATEEIVTQWASRQDFPATYLKQHNQGKHAAHNRGVNAARGRMFVNLDSDDRLLPDTLARMMTHWESIPLDERSRFAGVEGLVQSMDGARLLTKQYPASPFDASFLDTFYSYGIGGDKKHAVRLDVLRQYPYPVFPGERHIRPDLIWKRYSHKFIFRCVNEVFQQVEYQPDGLSSNRFLLRIRNPRGFQLACLEDLTLHRAWLTHKARVRRMIEYIRFSLHAQDVIKNQGRALSFTPLWILLFPLGTIRWLGDLYRLRVRHGVHPNRKVTRN